MPTMSPTTRVTIAKTTTIVVVIPLVLLFFMVFHLETILISQFNL